MDCNDEINSYCFTGKGRKISLRHDNGGTTKNLVYKAQNFYSIRDHKNMVFALTKPPQGIDIPFCCTSIYILSSTIVLAPLVYNSKYHWAKMIPSDVPAINDLFSFSVTIMIDTRSVLQNASHSHAKGVDYIIVLFMLYLLLKMPPNP